jgi:hypothetical protein
MSRNFLSSVYVFDAINHIRELIDRLEEVVHHFLVQIFRLYGRCARKFHGRGCLPSVLSP